MSCDTMKWETMFLYFMKIPQPSIFLKYLIDIKFYELWMFVNKIVQILSNIKLQWLSHLMLQILPLLKTFTWWNWRRWWRWLDKDTSKRWGPRDQPRRHVNFNHTWCLIQAEMTAGSWTIFIWVIGFFYPNSCSTFVNQSINLFTLTWTREPSL